jgi:hypothetical protein
MRRRIVFPVELERIFELADPEVQRQMRQREIDDCVEHLLMGVPFFDGGKR